MQRVALVAPGEDLPAVLAAAGRAALVEIDAAGTGPERQGRGSPGIEEVMGRMARSGPVAATTGWCPAASVDRLALTLAPHGGAVVRLPSPPGAEPPTLITGHGPSGAFQPLIDTYATVPYRDVNPAALAGLSYVLMFGMMFADVGHGLLLLVAGLVIRSGRASPHRPTRWAWRARLAPFWPFVIGCGIASTAAGLLFGEAFGPTGLAPRLWMQPLDHPTTLLAVALAVGGVLLAVSYAVGIVNRWREGGPASAVVALSGAAGAGLYAGLAAVVIGIVYHLPAMAGAGALLAGVGLVTGFVGCFAAAGGHGAGALQATVETFDATLRIGSNTVSFTRLAAFGLTHAALGEVIWKGTTGVWSGGPALWLPAALLFAVGNAAAFALEGLVAAVQALRLEYYEMFSRVFVTEGRPFRPWGVPRTGATDAAAGGPLGTGRIDGQEATCSRG